MEEKVIQCLPCRTVKEAINQAVKLKLTKEDIVNIFPHERAIYLIYYK